MSDAPTTAPSAPLDPRLERRLARVEGLAEMGMAMARLVTAQAKAAPQKAGELSLQFARIAKAVRQTLALEARFCDPPTTSAEPAEARPWVEYGMTEAEYTTAKRAADRRFETGMIVGRAIELEAERLEDERLLPRLAEEFEDLIEPELFRSEASLPEIIAGICADLGIAPDWDEWSDDDWGGLGRDDRAALRTGAEPFRPSQLHSRSPEASPALAEAP